MEQQTNDQVTRLGFAMYTSLFRLVGVFRHPSIISKSWIPLYEESFVHSLSLESSTSSDSYYGSMSSVVGACPSFILFNPEASAFDVKGYQGDVVGMEGQTIDMQYTLVSPSHDDLIFRLKHKQRIQLSMTCCLTLKDNDPVATEVQKTIMTLFQSIVDDTAMSKWVRYKLTYNVQRHHYVLRMHWTEETFTSDDAEADALRQWLIDELSNPVFGCPSTIHGQIHIADGAVSVHLDGQSSMIADDLLIVASNETSRPVDRGAWSDLLAMWSQQMQIDPSLTSIGSGCCGDNDCCDNSGLNGENGLNDNDCIDNFDDLEDLDDPQTRQVLVRNLANQFKTRLATLTTPEQRLWSLMAFVCDDIRSVHIRVEEGTQRGYLKVESEGLGFFRRTWPFANNALETAIADIKARRHLRQQVELRKRDILYKIPDSEETLWVYITRSP